ncbi:MAG: polymer-forming cytoskeletal protein [Chitinophagaceae bacterium]|nr:polymer-forming cytoskeletal protein [Chitinophagaceae bacterium]
MFNSKSSSSRDAATSNASTMIGAGTTITGDLESNGDIRIDGILNGNLKGKAKIIIGADGVVEGNIEGLQADIMGRVTGTIRVQELLFLHGKTEVHGDIYAGKLQVEPTAVFNGKCHMGANIVELKQEVASAVNQ